MKSCMLVFMGFCALLLSQGCSMRHMALDATGGILADASKEMEHETDWDVLQVALPANLKVFAGLYAMDKENRPLLATLAKGYAGYAFGVHETLYFAEKFADDPSGPHRVATLRGYRKAIYYGMHYLALVGIDYPGMVDANKRGELSAYLSQKIGEHDNEALQTLLYTGQSWVSLINLSKDNPGLVASLSLVRQLLDFGCARDPNFNFGFCPLYVASYEMALGKAMGGNPKKAEEYFQKAMKDYPDSLITYVTYMEKYLIPLQLQGKYNEVKRTLAGRIAGLRANGYSPVTATTVDPFDRPDGMLNAIAIKRFEIVQQFEDRLF